MFKWLKKKIAILSIAFARVEKNMLNNTGNMMDSDTSKHQKLTQGRLSDALINGEVTEQVKELRWRTYKILDKSSSLSTEIIGYDDDGLPITKTLFKSGEIRKLKVDDKDSFKPIIVVKNDPIMTSSITMMEVLDINEDNTEIDFNVMNNQNETEFPIEIERDDITALELEKYSSKMIVRDMEEEDKYLLEFYVPMYEDEYNKKSKFILSEIKKLINKPRFSNLTNIKKVKFVSNKSIGVKDNLFFEYDILSFDKIVEFNGFYVIKFKSKAIFNGFDITLIHFNEALDKKYENKEKK